MSRLVLALTFVVTTGSVARAEKWFTLEDYVATCNLIVKAKTVVEDKRLTFRVLESWRGTFDPKQFTEVTKDGRFFADRGEYGVNVVDGQEIVFFFTPDNERDPQKHSHPSTAFPVEDGTVLYAGTSDDKRIRKRYRIEAFKSAIQLVPTKP